MPFPPPEEPSEPITAGEWGCITLFVLASAHALAVTILT